VARYELLRGRALAGDPGGWRCGLAVLQHRGVVAWLHAWHPVAVITTGTPARSTTAALPAPAVADRLIEALASMALAALARR
jgi:hypothetical protein